MAIYIIINLNNNKCYIGSTVNFRKRKNEHLRMLRKGIHHSSHLQKSWDKYKEESFVFAILENVENLDVLHERENYWILKKDSMNPEYGYNLSYPLQNPSLFMREETIQKKKINAYNQFYKDSNITLEDYLNGKRKPKYIKTGIKSNKRVLLINKITNIKEYEFESIADTARFFLCREEIISRLCNKRLGKSFRGYIVIFKEEYEEGKDYRILKKEYKVKGKFEGHPVETFNLETKEIIKQYPNLKILCEELGSNPKYVQKVIRGEKKSFKGVGVRWSH